MTELIYSIYRFEPYVNDANVFISDHKDVNEALDKCDELSAKYEDTDYHFDVSVYRVEPEE